MVIPVVLIVEDETLLAVDLEANLVENGYSVCGIVASGEEAIIQASRHQPDVVLMDINLCGKMDGLQAGYQIHSTLGLPIVFMSAYLEALGHLPEEHIHFAYIAKPYDEEELLAALENILPKTPRNDPHH